MPPIPVGLNIGWLYVAGESGEVSLFHVQGQTVSAVATGVQGPNAHVIAVDEATHRAYFPLKSLGGKPALRITEPQQ